MKLHGKKRNSVAQGQGPPPRGQPSADRCQRVTPRRLDICTGRVIYNYSTGRKYREIGAVAPRSSDFPIFSARLHLWGVFTQPMVLAEAPKDFLLWHNHFTNPCVSSLKCGRFSCGAHVPPPAYCLVGKAAYWMVRRREDMYSAQVTPKGVVIFHVTHDASPHQPRAISRLPPPPPPPCVTVPWRVVSRPGRLADRPNGLYQKLHEEQYFCCG